MGVWRQKRGAVQQMNGIDSKFCRTSLCTILLVICDKCGDLISFISMVEGGGGGRGRETGSLHMKLYYT